MTKPSRSTPSIERPSLRIAAAAAPLRQQVVERLREAIADGRFLPGARLIERELCDLLAVSRTSLREALRELETEGLVKTIANRGVIVATITTKSAREIYEIRELFECLIAGRFAEFASSAQVAELEGCVRALAEAYRTRTGVMAAKNTFYEVLMAGAAHELASTMLRSIQIRASQLRLMTLSDPDRAARSIAEIKLLLSAIKRRDVAGAREAAASHIRNAAALALRLLEAAETRSAA